MVQLGLRLKGPSVMVVEFIQYMSARMSSEAVDNHIQLKLNAMAVMFVMYIANIIIIILLHFWSFVAKNCKKKESYF